MRLYSYPRSSAAYRCRIALNLKQVAAELHAIDLGGTGTQLLPDYLAINPQALVPALQTDEGAVITQSLAIIEWLDEAYPDPPLLPGDATRRAHIRAFALAIACEIHPLQNLRVQNYLRCDLMQDKAAVSAWLERWIGGGLAACEALLAAQPSGQGFAFGATPSLADIALAPQLFSAHRFGIGIGHLPYLVRLDATYRQTEAFVAAHPDHQPD